MCGEVEIYKIADKIVEYIEDIQLSELKGLPDDFIRILFGSLVDNEISIKDKATIYWISRFLFSGDKRLAQAAVVCLVDCCGKLGADLVKEAISKKPYHIDLIIGMVKLLGEEIL